MLRTEHGLTSATYQAQTQRATSTVSVDVTALLDRRISTDVATLGASSLSLVIGWSHHTGHSQWPISTPSANGIMGYLPA